jgi:hypothetical protein
MGLGLSLAMEAGEALVHSLEHHSTKKHGPMEKHA